MRSDRLLSILLLLQAHRQITTAELARQLNVSERTIHRDMTSLSAAGFPVYAERGKHGGWKLLDEFHTRLASLNPSDLPALFLQVPEKLLQDLGLDKSAGQAQLKLLAALPERVRAAAESFSQRIYLDTSGWHGSEGSTRYLSEIQNALWSDRRILLQYQRADGSVRERLVNPLGLVAKGQIWYLVAQTDEDIRVYRTTRILSLTVTGESFVRPASFQLPAFWEESSRQFIRQLPRYTAIVRVDPAVGELSAYPARMPAFDVLEESDQDGWRVMALHFQIEDEACAYIMRFGNRMEVLEPASLRELIIRLAEEIRELYLDTSSPSTSLSK